MGTDGKHPSESIMVFFNLGFSLRQGIKDQKTSTQDKLAGSPYCRSG